MILIALFILISTIAILGYFESRKINSILERITYQMDSRYTDTPPVIKEESPIENFEEQEQEQEQEQQQQQEQQQEQQQQQQEQEQQEQQQSIPITFLTESKEEFSTEVPEDQSSFSLGAIFKGADSKDITKIDSIESDSEYGDSYSSEESVDVPEESEEEEKEKDVKEILTEGIETMTIKQLKVVCKKLNISPYGTKAKMIKKIKDSSKI
jgi:hypothetical protein